jgi:hypothetical protein
VIGWRKPPTRIGKAAQSRYYPEQPEQTGITQTR